jgi:hypothetical protein
MAARVLPLAIVLALLCCVPAVARPIGPAVGIGEQKPGIFTSPQWRRLGLHYARYIAPWDALDDPVQLARLDAWMAQARRARVRVLLGFGHSVRNRWRARRLPTVTQFEDHFWRFRERYPWVTDWLVWNEANNGHSLTKRRPRLVARYYNAIVPDCPGCNVIGADVLDDSNMAWWIKWFRHYARPRPRIWGLHNYIDANYGFTRGTLRLLALTRGQIWFTETGGVVLRRIVRRGKVVKVLRYGVQRAALATERVFRLACLSPRITRVYLYHWRAPRKATNWDSALLDARGRPRPAYRVLQRYLFASAQASRRGGRRALCGGQF